MELFLSKFSESCYKASWTDTKIYELPARKYEKRLQYWRYSLSFFGIPWYSTKFSERGVYLPIFLEIHFNEILQIFSSCSGNSKTSSSFVELLCSLLHFHKVIRTLKNFINFLRCFLKYYGLITLTKQLSMGKSIYPHECHWNKITQSLESFVVSLSWMWRHLKTLRRSRWWLCPFPNCTAAHAANVLEPLGHSGAVRGGVHVTLMLVSLLGV